MSYPVASESAGQLRWIGVVMPIVGVEAGTAGGAPPTQAPDEQKSPAVQALPSSQEPTTFEWTQPLAGLHESVVHWLLSLQLSGVMPVHVAPLQVPKAHWFPPIEQVDPPAASAHVELQQSPLVELPSSHVSPSSVTPLPHTIK